MKKQYTCPMHPEIIKSHQTPCPICGMKLVVKGSKQMEHSSMQHQDDNNKTQNYTPLFIIIGLIFTSALAISYPTFEFTTLVSSFMAIFFITFAGFKLLDLKGFAEGYQTYDLLAKKWNTYGYIYPFIELFFGLSMIVGLWMTEVLWLEVIIMTFSGIGVLLKLSKNERFQCVCLGTFLKVPLTKVTLIEDFGMAALAIIMLIVK